MALKTYVSLKNTDVATSVEARLAGAEALHLQLTLDQASPTTAADERLRAIEIPLEVVNKYTDGVLTTDDRLKEAIKLVEAEITTLKALVAEAKEKVK